MRFALGVVGLIACASLPAIAADGVEAMCDANEVASCVRSCDRAGSPVAPPRGEWVAVAVGCSLIHDEPNASYTSSCTCYWQDLIDPADLVAELMPQRTASDGYAGLISGGKTGWDRPGASSAEYLPAAHGYGSGPKLPTKVPERPAR